jgi:uracil-DNA glycosylase
MRQTSELWPAKRTFDELLSWATILTGGRRSGNCSERYPESDFQLGDALSVVYNDSMVTDAASQEKDSDSLERVASEVRVCPLCDLSRTRTLAVPGAGSATAKVMFIGEGPGWNEDQQGLPFVGAAGKFLDELLGIAGLNRSDVFITNVVKCRPPGNRDPLPDEIAACNGYLDRQVALIDPPLVVTLGRFSMAKWFSGEKISKIHGQPKQFGRLTVLPMFHPAAALRSPDVRRQVEADFAKLPAVLAAAEQARQKLTESEPVVAQVDQLKLFQ